MTAPTEADMEKARACMSRKARPDWIANVAAALAEEREEAVAHKKQAEAAARADQRRLVEAGARLARAEKIIAEQQAAMVFTLANVFDPPNGWYSDDVFPDMPGTPEEQIEAGRDHGPAYVSHARARLRAALALTLDEEPTDAKKEPGE